MELNPQQQAAVEYDGGHVLVLAGAGTGKTRVIIERVAYLLRRGNEPSKILMLTFTRRAAKEMVERLNMKSGISTNGIVSGTFHHFCLYMMRRMPRHFNIEGYTVIDRDDQQQLMKHVRHDLVAKGEIMPKAAELVDLYSFARNTNQPILSYLQKYTDFDPKKTKQVIALFKEYHERKIKSMYLDYDDILFRFAKSINENQQICQKIKNMFGHILVDEMQDTNPLQWLILDALRDPAKLFCVGDDAQSIYAFRGADFRNVHSFTERVPDSEILKLEENYRSSQEILDVANWLLAESPLKYNKHLTAYRGPGNKPEIVEFRDDMEEANWIADDLIRRYKDGVKWKDHMVITRTGFASRAFEGALIEKKIPYRFIGGTTLLQAAHIKDLFALIRCAANYQDELAWFRYLMLWPRLGPASANRLISGMREQKDYQSAVLYLTDNLKDDNIKLIDGIKIIHDNWHDCPNAVKCAMDFFDDILKNKYSKWSNRLKDFKLLMRLGKPYKNVIAFVEAYTLDPITTSEMEKVKNEDAVILITVHSAKGTEAPVCYLIKAQPEFYPHNRSRGDAEAEEEERRVLYVAMTRAMNELVLTRSCERDNYRKVNYGYQKSIDSNTPYFLEKIPGNLINFVSKMNRRDEFSDYDVIKPFYRTK